VTRSSTPGWVGILWMAGRARLLPLGHAHAWHGESCRDALHAHSRGRGGGVGMHAPMYGSAVPALFLLAPVMPKAGLMAAGAAATHRRNPEPWQSWLQGQEG